MTFYNGSFYISTGTNFTRFNSDPMQTVWSMPFGNGVVSYAQPTLSNSGNVLYVKVPQYNNKKNTTILSFYAATGTPMPGIYVLPEANVEATTTVAVGADNSVYTVSYGGRLVALTNALKFKWTFAGDNSSTYATSPAIDGVRVCRLGRRGAACCVLTVASLSALATSFTRTMARRWSLCVSASM